MKCLSVASHRSLKLLARYVGYGALRTACVKMERAKAVDIVNDRKQRFAQGALDSEKYMIC